MIQLMQAITFTTQSQKSPTIIEGLKKLRSNGNEKADELLKNIKREGQILVNSI